MKLWLTGGSSSGVGKSTFALKLAEILPDSEYMKLGHGPKRLNGPPNYFTVTGEAIRFIETRKDSCRHLVIEATRLVGKYDADITIFLNRDDENRRVDSDEMLQHADIILGDHGNPEEWQSKLETIELAAGVRKKVLRLLQDQHEFVSGKNLALRTKIWFVHEGKTVFGEGMARLLSGVSKYGSLSKAAKKEGISYRHAWGDIKRAEERLGFALLDRQTGGSEGGGSALTPKAKILIDGYWRIKRKAIRESDKWLEKLLDEIGSDSE